MVLQPDVVQCEGYRLQRRLTLLGAQLALPYRDTVPSHLRQPPLLLLVALLVPAYLRHPKIPIRLRNLTARRINYEL